MSVVANVAINVDSRNAVSKLREVQNQAQQTERAFGGLSGAIGKLAIAAAALQTARFVFAKTAEIETQTRSLQVLTGSAEKAGKIIKELQQLGAVTPFTSTELIDSAKRLQAFGVEAERVVETTRRLADVSGATGAELQGLVTAYGQVQAKGRLQGEELLQFQERGVALQEELRKMYGLSGDEFQKALSKGRIGAESVEVAIIRLTDAGGKYANGAIAQSDTLAGKFSTLTDGVESLARTIGTILSPALKAVIDLANQAIDGINKALAGPDLKTANDRLFNIRARIKEIQDAIAAGQKANIGMAAGPQVLGIDGQVLGGGAPALPNLKFELQQLQKEAKKLEDRIKGLRQTQPTGGRAGGTTPPPLLAETSKEKLGRQLSVSDLLGGDIQRQLQQRQAQLEVATAREMNVAAAQPNAEQSKRMVESASKLLGIKYQIDAIDKTITARDQVREKIISSSRDKTYAALAFDEQTNDLKAARANLERDIDKAMLEQLGKAEAQYRQEQQAIQDALAGLDSEIIKIGAVSDAQKQALKFIEIENTLKKQGITLTELDATAIRKKIAEINNQTKAQQAAKDKAELAQQQFAAIGSTIGNQLTGAFDNLINKTQEWNDVLRSSLAAIGKVLMMAGLNMLAGADGKGFLNFLGFGNGLGTRAAGGPVAGGSPYLVGEKGPELFVPGTGGSVVPTNDLRSAMSSGGSPVLNMSFQSTNIGGVEYVSRDQLEAAMAATRRDASRDGARRGMSMTLDKLQQSPGTRGRVGLR